MDNQVNNIKIQEAIVNAYNNGLLGDKTPEEAAKILFDFGDKMHNASNFFNYTKDFQAEHTLDISQSMTKEQLYNEMKKILNMDKSRGRMYEGKDKEFDEFFELFFNIFDQNGDGSMDTSELTLFDNDDGDSGINVYTFHETLATDELENFTYNPDDSVGDTASFSTASPTSTPDPTATPAPTETPKPTATSVPTETPKPTDAPTAKPTETVANEPTVNPTAEPTVNPTAEPTVNPTAEPTVNPTAETTVNPAAETTVNPAAETTEVPSESSEGDKTEGSTKTQTAAEKPIRDNVVEAILYADYENNEVLKDKTPEEIAQILYEFGSKFANKNFTGYTKETQSRLTLDISKPMTKEELYNKLKEILNMNSPRKEQWLFKDTTQKFDEYFEVFFAVFDQNGDGKLETSELTLLDNNVNGDTGINVQTLRNTLYANGDLQAERFTNSEAAEQYRQEKAEAEARAELEQAKQEVINNVESSLSYSLDDEAKAAIDKLNTALYNIKREEMQAAANKVGLYYHKPSETDTTPYKEEYFNVITSLYDEDSEYFELPPEQKLGVLMAAIEMNSDMMKEYFLGNASEAKVVLVKLFNELAEKAVSPEGELNDEALKNLENLTSSFDSIFAEEYSRIEPWQGIGYDSEADFLDALYDRYNSSEKWSNDARRDIGHLPDVFIYNFMSYIGDGSHGVGTLSPLFSQEVNTNYDSPYLKKQYVIDNISNLYAHAKSPEDIERINNLFNLYSLKCACTENHSDGFYELTQIYDSIITNEEMWESLADDVNLTDAQKNVLESDKDIAKMSISKIIETYNNGDYTIDEARYIIYTKIKNMDLSNPKEIKEFISKELLLSDEFPQGGTLAYLFEDFMNLLAGTTRELPTDEELEAFYKEH